MAKKQHNGWVKLGIGTLSVAALVGATGAISQRAELQAAELQAAELESMELVMADPVGDNYRGGIGLQEADYKEGNSDDDNGSGSVRFGSPGDDVPSYRRPVRRITSRRS